jgi:hypothetical protein
VPGLVRPSGMQAMYTHCLTRRRTYYVHPVSICMGEVRGVTRPSMQMGLWLADASWRPAGHMFDTKVRYVL